MEFLITHKGIIVIAHAISAAVGLGAVVVTDTLFFKFLKDFKINKLENEILNNLSRVIWAVIVLMLITGAMLFFGSPLEYLISAKFIAKMVIFGIIVLNGIILNIFISPYLRRITFGPVAVQPSNKLRIIRHIAFASGAVSFVSWFTVFILGSVRSIPATTGQALLAYGAIVFVAVIGSQGFALYLKYGQPKRR